MKIKYILPPALISTVLFLLVHCERFVEVDYPTNQISQFTVFKDKSTALSALADVYANLRSNSLLSGNISGVTFLTGCYTDELQTNSTQQNGIKAFYDLTVQSTTPAVDDIWISAYRNIYAVNNIIDGVARSGAYLDESTRNTLTGEALAIRALLHLYLAGLYGEVPYVETTTYAVNQNISKSTTVQIYAKLQSDLLQAENLLSETYATTERTRINRSAARLLLARVFIYHQEWEKARHYANLVKASPTYSLESSLANVFLKGAKSTVWQFAPVDTGANTLEGQTFIIRGTPPPYGFLSPDMISSFETGDLRRSSWTKSIVDGSTVYYYPFKYREYTKTPVSLEYSVILRIEEAYLIAAEAENNLGNTAEALQNLNSIRVRAGLTTPSSATPQEIQNLIVQEKHHEFFTEGGHRFLDLKRWNLLGTTLQPVKPQWQNFMKNWPLPQRELLVNSNLKPQNDGY